MGAQKTSISSAQQERGDQPPGKRITTEPHSQPAESRCRESVARPTMVGLQRRPMKMILNGWCQQWPHSFCFWRCGRTMETSPRTSLPHQAQVYGKVDDKLPLSPCNSFCFAGSDAPSRPRTVARKASLISRPAVKEPPLRPIERKKRLTYQEFAEKYDGQRPVIVENVASNWSATKDWSRKRFANAYRNEMLVLTVTQSGLNKS